MVRNHDMMLPVSLEDFIRKIESEDNLDHLVSKLVEEYFIRINEG